MSMLKTLCRYSLLLLALHGAQAMAAEAKLTHAVIDLPERRVASPWSQVIVNQAEWDAFYRESTFPYNGGTGVVVPEIDFTKNTVVVGGLGSEYWTSELMVRYAIGGGERVYLGIAILTPGATCVVAQAITWPTLALLIPEPDAKIEFHLSRVVQNCE